MNLKKIEELQKQNAATELSGWMKILLELKPEEIKNVEQVKQALFILSSTTKALRRHGHFLGLDSKEENSKE